MDGMLGEYGIDKGRQVTFFTTNTAVNQKKAIRDMGVPWVACANHAFELSFRVVANHPEIKGVVLFPSPYIIKAQQQ